MWAEKKSHTFLLNLADPNRPKISILKLIYTQNSAKLDQGGNNWLSSRVQLNVNRK